MIMSSARGANQISSGASKEQLEEAFALFIEASKAIESQQTLLQAEIERITLTQMIEKYEELLGQDLPEGRWQEFFENYKFVLSLAFARPVQLLHAQFHARTSAVDGAGAQIGFGQHRGDDEPALRPPRLAGTDVRPRPDASAGGRGRSHSRGHSAIGVKLRGG